MKRIAYVQHAAEEGPGAIRAWAAARGVALQGFRSDEGELPCASAMDGTIVLGGPFSATDGGPAWLDAERAWLAHALVHAHPILGICLGGQLVASALGAAVTRGCAEAGWVDVTLTAESGADMGTVRALTWHDDTFALPIKAMRIGRSAGCPEQGFRRGERIVALQFHPEWTPEIVAAMGSRLGAATPAAVHAPGDYDALHRCLFAILDRWRASREM